MEGEGGGAARRFERLYVIQRTCLQCLLIHRVAMQVDGVVASDLFNVFCPRSSADAPVLNAALLALVLVARLPLLAPIRLSRLLTKVGALTHAVRPHFDADVVRAVCLVLPAGHCAHERCAHLGLGGHWLTLCRTRLLSALSGPFPSTSRAAARSRRSSACPSPAWRSEPCCTPVPGPPSRGPAFFNGRPARPAWSRYGTRANRCRGHQHPQIDDCAFNGAYGTGRRPRAEELLPFKEPGHP